MDAPRPLTELLMELLAIPSVIGDERAIADFVESRLRRRLRDVRRVGNAVVGIGPRQGRPRLGLVGHLDTVAAAPGDVHAPTVDAGRVHGLGSSDMKSAIACDLLLLEELDLDTCPFDLTWVYYDKEEGPIADNGLRALFVAVPEILGLDLAVCGEPTDNAVQLGCVGSLHARVTFRGKAAHSARPWQGENAITKAWELLRALDMEKPRDVNLDGLVFRETLAATLASGGRSRNVIPDEFSVNVNARYSAATDASQVEARLRALAPGADVRIEDLAPAAPPRRDHPLIGALVKVAGGRVEPKQAWTDVAQFAERGVAAVNFGPGEQAQAHQRGESVSLTAVAKGHALRKAFLTGTADASVR